MIHTSSFFKYDNHKGTLFLVANSMPKKMPYECIKLKSFVPSWDLVKSFKDNKISWEEYTTHYLAYLNGLPDDSEDIQMLKNTEECTLLCWEPDSNNCHRSILANWLEEKHSLIKGDVK